MKNKLLGKISVIGLGVLIVSMFYGCSGGGGEGGGGGGNGKRPAATVRVWRAEPTDVARTVEAVGTLEADKDVTVSAEVEARLKRIVRDEGERVGKGDVLAVLDNEKFVLEVERLEADLKKAGADLDFSKTDFERKGKLFDDGVISKEAFDEARSKMDGATGLFDSARARLLLAKKDLFSSSVRAPFGGYISRRYVTVGSYLQEGDRVFRLMDTDPVKVLARVSESKLGRVRVGQPLTIKIRLADKGRASGAGKINSDIFTGKIYFISPDVDEDTRSFRVKARIANQDGFLKPGLFADVVITTDVLRGVFLVPEKAVIAGVDKTVIFTVSDNKASLKEVEVAGRRDGRVIIKAHELTSGELVVVDGAHKLRHGMAVSIIDEKGDREVRKTDENEKSKTNNPVSRFVPEAAATTTESTAASKVQSTSAP